MKKILTLTLAAALLSLFQLSAQIDRSKAPRNSLWTTVSALSSWRTMTVLSSTSISIL